MFLTVLKKKKKRRTTHLRVGGKSDTSILSCTYGKQHINNDTFFNSGVEKKMQTLSRGLDGASEKERSLTDSKTVAIGREYVKKKLTKNILYILFLVFFDYCDKKVNNKKREKSNNWISL